MDSSIAKAYKVLSEWLHGIDSPISLTPGVVTVSGDHGGGSDVVNELFFSLVMWDPEVCHSLRAMECGPTRPWKGSQRCEPLSL